MSISTKLLLSADNARHLVEGKRVFLRVDFNVPLGADGRVTSDLRLVAALPTLRLLVASGARRVIVASHLGRPEGRREVDRMSLAPVARHLRTLLGQEIIFAPDCIGKETEELCNNAKVGSIILLENLRFHVEEEGKGKDAEGKVLKASPEAVEKFRQQLRSLSDVYINDAFGTAHRAHSSIVGFSCFETRAAGLLMAKEIANFGIVLESPKRPVLTIMGGAKVADKIKLIMNLLDKTNIMIICGGMAFTFLKELKGMEIGKSLYDAESIPVISKIMAKAKEKHVEIILPCDFVTAPAFDSTDTSYSEGSVPKDQMGLDIGPKSVKLFSDAVAKASTILWNGPPGVFEKKQFEKGSIELLKAVTDSKAIKIAGGGDTTSLVLREKCEEKFDLVSTGGGASLELLEGKDLPGITSLSSV